jgi:hypothetical protein
MILFLLVSLPVLFAFFIFLPWDASQAPGRFALLSTSLKGALIFFPGYLLILLARRIFGFSYDGFLLYLSLLLRDYMAPVLVALGGFLLLKTKINLLETEEGIFLSVLAYLCGFFALLNISDLLRAWRNWDSYMLFLLPVLRIALVLLVSLLARRYARWQGRDGAIFCGACAALALLPALASYLYRINRMGLATLFTVAGVLTGAVLFVMRFPRVVRG